jgi:hypothetical protein
MSGKKIEIDIAKVYELASRGLTEAQIGRFFSVSLSTISRRKRDSDNFGEAIKKGRAKGLREVTNALFNSAVEGNVTAQIFYLANRDRENWQHVSRIEHAAKGGAAFVAWLPEPIESIEEWAQKHGGERLEK